MGEKFEIPIDYFIKNHNHVTRDLRPSDCAKCLIGELKQQLADADKVIDEVTSRCVYTYCNTQCRSTRERVIEIAKLCEKHKSKYKVGE